MQAAFQERGLNVLDPENAGRRRFRFCAVEQDSPFALIVADMSELVRALGIKEIVRSGKIAMVRAVQHENNHRTATGTREAG